MSLNDPLANILSSIELAEKSGKQQVLASPSSKLIKNVLKIMQSNHYIGDFKEINNNKGGILEINLIGAINKCGTVKPRYNVSLVNYKKFEKRYLPAFGFGILLVSTSKGLMTHEEAIKNNVGGKIIAFVY
ncbi:30S ribosomal protein S8 [Candidatus Woesearchaeota archaeon]|nr:30S ribosomal protein S8 [Candidatus Woesearchaeota archaeon]